MRISDWSSDVFSSDLSMQSLKRVGRVGFKSLLYFEVLTTLALVIGLIGVNLMEPGTGMHFNPAPLDPHAIDSYRKLAHEQSVVGFLTHILPDRKIFGTGKSV